MQPSDDLLTFDCATNIACLEDVSPQPGVYFCYSGGRLVYVGKSANAARRVSSHHLKGFENVIMLPLPVEQIDEVEAAMIAALQPPWNRAGVSRDLWEPREESRIRMSVSVTLDPDLFEWLTEWTKDQPGKPAVGRIIDELIERFRDEQEAKAKRDKG